MSSCNRNFSSIVVDGDDRAPNRSMLRAVGFEDEDFAKPQVAVCSAWSMVTPCNSHLDELGKASVEGVDEAGGKAVPFGTITVSDGISMGTPGMRYSLVSREVIADSIETVVGAEGMDGVVTIGGCDKNMPACLIALARLNRPGVFVYGGTILPGIHKDKNLDIVSVFEAVGSHASGAIDHAELVEIEKKAIPGPGSCGGMYTANTMSSAIEALGMSLPDSSAQLAVSEDKRKDAQDAGAAVLNLIERDIKPRDIMTRKAFENAITVVITLGGSTNAVLHLLAMAHAAGVPLELDDFTEIGKRVPVLCDLKPSGKYNMSHFVRIGGLRPLLKTLLEEGLLHGDCMTVTGKTLAENVEGAPTLCPYPGRTRLGPAIRRSDQAGQSPAYLVWEPRPEGAVAKITGKEGLRFSGKAIVYESEEASLKGILDGEVEAGHVVVIRNEGPVGGPGCVKCFLPHPPSWAKAWARKSP